MFFDTQVPFFSPSRTTASNAPHLNSNTYALQSFPPNNVLSPLTKPKHLPPSSSAAPTLAPRSNRVRPLAHPSPLTAPTAAKKVGNFVETTVPNSHPPRSLPPKSSARSQPQGRRQGHQGRERHVEHDPCERRQEAGEGRGRARRHPGLSVCVRGSGWRLAVENALLRREEDGGSSAGSPIMCSGIARLMVRAITMKEGDDDSGFGY